MSSASGREVLMELFNEEEIEFFKRQRLTRKSLGGMEGLQKGEVRRVNIVYYLSIKGKIEPAHLISIRIHYNGVYLRDVKRWLSDLRGKEMPDSFAWSYKRRYRTKFVWQDLMDGDLITPICDNEYILKGTHIPSSPYPFSSYDSELSPGENSPRCIDGEAATEPEVTKVSVMETFLAEMKTVKLEDTNKVLPDEHKCSGNVSMMGEELKEVQDVETPPPPAEIGITYHQVSDKRSKSCTRASRLIYSTFSCGIEDNKGSPLLPLQREGYRRSFNPLRYIKWKLRG